MVATASIMGRPVDDVRGQILTRLREGRLELPLLPEAATEAMSLLRAPSADPRRLLSHVRRDAALTAHVLRMASSQFYGRGMKVVSMAQVVARLGTVSLSEIVLTTCARSPRFAVAGFDREVKQAFEHAFATAFFGQEIARIKRWNVEDAFLCGLLHDLGYPVALQAVVSVAPRLARTETLDLAEQLHTEIGAVLVESWALPPSVVDAARHHHQPERAAAHAPQATMAQLSDILADQLLERPSAWEGDPATHPAALALHLYPEEVAAVQAKQASILDTLQALA